MLARGSVEVDGVTLAEGDGASFVDPQTIAVRSLESSELILFDLA